jgi:hypothetical protein
MDQNQRTLDPPVTFGLHLGEAQASINVAYASACNPLPAVDGDIDVERIELDDASDPAGPLCG